MSRLRQIKHLTILAAIVVGLPASGADRLALVIGINNYQTLGRLTTCVNDAQAVAQALGKVGYGQVVMLTDIAKDSGNLPTGLNIRRRMTHFVELSEPGDTILIFFSGHSVMIGNKGYLVPLDGDATAEGSIPLTWLCEQMVRSKASAKLLCLDACHSGSAAKGVSGIVPSLATSSDLIMLLSSARDQVSYPDEQLGCSVFTRYLVTGLSGAAAAGGRTLTAEALFAYIKTQMKRWSLDNGKLQTPLLVGESPSGLILASLPETGTTPGIPASGEDVVGIPQNRSGAATTILKTMKEKGILKIAVMSDNTAFGKAGKEQIEKLAPIHGIEIIANEVYDKNTTDITDVLTKIKGARAQAVINWSLMPARSVVSRDIKRIELGVPLFQGPEVGNDR